jgi:hypothetical protein
MLAEQCYFIDDFFISQTVGAKKVLTALYNVIILAAQNTFSKSKFFFTFYWAFIAHEKPHIGLKVA